MSPALRLEILHRFASPEIVGVLLGGSFARGETTSSSDVDLLILTRKRRLRTGEIRCSRAESENRLLTWSLSTVARERARMNSPETAIWVVPGIRQTICLLDRDDSVTELQAAARTFRWELVADRGRRKSSEMLATLCEEVGKLVAARRLRQPYRAANALMGLESGLSMAVAIAFGVMIPTENTWLEAVEERVGHDSPWSRTHRRMLGLSPGRAPGLWDRVEAALRCYEETASLFGPFVRPADRRVVRLARTLARTGAPGPLSD